MAKDEVKLEHAGTVEDLDILGTGETYPRAVRAHFPPKAKTKKGGDSNEEVNK